jgi:hypothetical protein
MRKYRAPLLLVVLILIVLSMLPVAAQISLAPADAHYNSATLVDLEKRVQRDPRMWVFDTPVTWTEVETFRMWLKVDGKTYVVDYTPDVQPGYFPAAWKPGARIEVRSEGRKMFLKLPGYDELPANIIKRESK